MIRASDQGFPAHRAKSGHIAPALTHYMSFQFFVYFITDMASHQLCEEKNSGCGGCLAIEMYNDRCM